MASNKDTKDLANKLGLHVPKSLADEEQLKLIADQIGMNNYEPTEKGNADLYKALKDKELHIKVPVHTITMVNGTTIQTEEVPSQELTPGITNSNDNQNSGDLKNSLNEAAPKSNNEPVNSNKPEEPKQNKEKTNQNDEIETLDGYDDVEPNTNPTQPSDNNNQGDTEPSPEQEANNEEPREQSEEATNQSNNKGEENKKDDDPNKDGNEKKENDSDKEEKPSSEKKDNEPSNNNETNKDGQNKDNNQNKSDNQTNKETKKDNNETGNKANKSSSNKADPNNTLNNKAGQKNERKTNSDVTKNGRKNLNQAKKAKEANNVKKATQATKGGVKKKAGETTKKAAQAIGNGIKAATKAIATFINNTLIPLIMSNPWILVIFVMILFLAIVLIVILMGANPKIGHNTGYQGSQCSYDLTGVVNTGNVSLNDVVVELINCDGRPNNYTVLETVDFEKYVLGVALAQMGEDAPDEAIKAQIIVARNFALTRNSTMCVDDPENCFYGYNISTGKIRMRACDLDQVYWDYEKSIYTDESSGVKKYSPEATSETGLLWKTSLTGERREEVLALAKEVKGKVLLDDEDKVLKVTSSLAAVNNIFSLAYEGKVYEEILASSYGSRNVNTSNCSSLGNIDYGDYNLNSDGDRILHTNLATFLSENGTSIDEFNGIIAKNVNNSGYGTRAGVVTAAITLVAELGNKYDVRVPYFWGGGHSGGISEYADPTWGSSSCHINANSQSYNYCGLDCTGFVSWALHNGGYNLNSARGNFYKMDGAKKVNLSEDEAVLQPGDLLESKTHVVMVIGIDNDRRQYICVEASGNEDGIWFTRRDFSIKGYWGVQLDDYYNDGSNVRS